jgi:hypothetical protein
MAAADLRAQGKFLLAEVARSPQVLNILSNAVS